MAQGFPKRSALANRYSKLLIFGVVAYIPVQWIAGRHPGSTSIFSPRHQVLRQNIQAMTAALRLELLSQCETRGVHRIYLYDSDVISPYLLNNLAEAPDCHVIRETVVTPVPDAERIGCDRIVVKEGLLSAWLPGHHWDDTASLNGKVAVVRSWASPSGEYDFQILRAKGCSGATLQGGAGE